MVRRTTGTRGYSGYRGRRHGRKVLAVLLALILAAACGFLFAQRYIVYEADGSFRFEFPWSKPQEQTQDKDDANGETGKKDDLEITTNVRMRDVEEAQQRIVDIIRDLEEKGVIVIMKGGKDDIIA